MNNDETKIILDRLVRERDQARDDCNRYTMDLAKTRDSLGDAMEVLTLVRPCIGQSVPTDALPNAVEFAQYLLGRLNQVVEDPEIAAAAAADGKQVLRLPRVPVPLLALYADFTTGRLSEAELPAALEEMARLMRTPGWMPI